MPEFWIRVQQSYVSDTLMIAMKLACYTAVRISELLRARWDTGEVNFENREWVIPASRMKLRRDHVVPLTDQTVELFKIMYDSRLDDGFIFKQKKDPGKRCPSESILAIIKRNGYEKRMTTHGFRSIFSTLANESKLFREDVIEYQIAHVPKNKIRGIYNRAEYWPERVELMTWYANEVDKWIKSRVKIGKRGNKCPFFMIECQSLCRFSSFPVLCPSIPCGYRKHVLEDIF